MEHFRTYLHKGKSLVHYSYLAFKAAQKNYIQHIHAAHASASVQAPPQTLVPLVLEVDRAAVAEQPERQVKVDPGVDDKVYGTVELSRGRR